MKAPAHGRPRGRRVLRSPGELGNENESACFDRFDPDRFGLRTDTAQYRQAGGRLSDGQTLVCELCANIASQHGFSLAKGKDVDSREQLAFDPSPETLPAGMAAGSTTQFHDADARREQVLCGNDVQRTNDGRFGSLL